MLVVQIVFCFFFGFVVVLCLFFFFFFSSRRRHTRSLCDWSSDVCSSDLDLVARGPRSRPGRDRSLIGGGAAVQSCRRGSELSSDGCGAARIVRRTARIGNPFAVGIRPRGSRRSAGGGSDSDHSAFCQAALRLRGRRCVHLPYAERPRCVCRGRPDPRSHDSRPPVVAKPAAVSSPPGTNGRQGRPGPGPDRRQSLRGRRCDLVGRRASHPWEAPVDRDTQGPQLATLQQIKGRIHRQLIERLNLSNLDRLEREEVVAGIRKVVQELLTQENAPLNLEERERLLAQVVDEIFGLGPLEPLRQDPEVSDILVNTYKQVYVERHGKLEPTDVRFQNDKHLLQVIDRIVSAVGRRIDDSSPMVDARLPDGSRVNAIIPPLAIDGPHLSIRKFKRDALSGEDLLRMKSLTPAMLELVQGVVRARLNVLISGGTGAGKTTLLNILSSFIPADERIVTIEDSAELQLRQPHVVRLETRSANIEGQGEVSQRQLLINSLRMRPDRIIIGEVRGPEAIDMLQAMNTGHDGSLTTLHANGPRDALGRLETMVSMANPHLPEKAVRQQTASAIDVVIQVSRLADGTRKVMTIAEVVGMEGDVITMQDIFGFERRGIDAEGHVVGMFRPTGIRPRFAERLQSWGIELPAELFAPLAAVPGQEGARW